MSEAYSRLYHRFKREFPAIYGDDHALATWVRLLMLADASWPLMPPVPRSVRAKPLAALVGASLVTVTEDSYTVLGLDAERTRRSDAGRIGAAVRWQSDPQANAMPSRSKAKQRRDETSKAEHGPSTDEDDGRADLEAFLVINRRAPTPKQRRLLDDVLDRRDMTGPEWAADVMFKHPDDPIGAVLEADKAYRAERIAEAQAQEAPKPRPRRSGSGLPETTREIMAEMALLRNETA